MAYSAPTMATIRNAERADALWYLSALGRSESLMWSCQVNSATIATGDRIFAVDTGVLHNGYVFADFATSPGLALYVTTATGVERVRFKGSVDIAQPVSATVTVAENNIVWADDQVLMLYHDYPVFPVFPRIDAAGVFYKDYDVAYTDENEDPIPVAIMGPDWAGFLVAGTAVATLDASDSYAIKAGATVNTWAWVAEPAAGAVIDDAVAETTFVTFSATGFWWIKLTVTDDNGKSDYTRRLFWVHDASYPPIFISGFSFNNTYDSSISTGQFVVRDDQADEDTIPDETRLLVWSDDKLDGIQSYQGGWTGRQMSKWGGYAIGGSLRRTPGRSEMQFEAEGATSILDRSQIYSIALEYASDPSAWWQYGDGGITVTQAIHHLWRYHSTLFNVRDVILPTSNALRAKYVEDFEKDTLLMQAKNLSYEHGIFANVCYNEAGIIYVEPDAQIYPVAIPAGFALDNADWVGDLEIEYQPVNRVSFLQMSGFSFDGMNSAAIISKAPGGVMADRGQGGMDIERQILEDQAGANVLVGRVMAKENNSYPHLSMELTAANSQTQAFRVAPQQWHDLTIAAADTVRGLDWSAGQDLVVREISAEYTPGKCKKSIIFEPYTLGPTGVTGDYPITPEEPPTEEPPVPPPWPPLPPEPSEVFKYAVVFDNTNGCYWTPDRGASWTARNTGLPATAFLCGMVLRGWQQIQGTNDPERAILVGGGDGFLAVSLDAGKTWQDRTPVDLPAGIDVFVDLDCPNDITETFFALLRNAGSTKTYLAKTEDLGLTWVYHQIGGVGITDGTYYYATEVNDWGGGEGYENIGGGWWRYWYNELEDLGNLAGQADGSYARSHHYSENHLAGTGSKGYNIHEQGFVCDMGVVVSGVGSQIALKCGWENGFNGAFPAIYVASTEAAYNLACNCPPGTNPRTLAGWTNLGGFCWTYNGAGCPHSQGQAWAPSKTTNSTFRYLMIVAGNGTIAQPPGSFYWDGDAIRVLGTTVTEMDSRPFGMAIDFEDGTRIYVTFASTDPVTMNESIYLAQFDADMVMQHAFSLTNSDSVLGAYPRTVWQPTVANFGDIVAVHGSQVGPTGYVGYSTDGGVTVVDQTGALTAVTDVTALGAKGDGAGAALYWNAYTDTPNVYTEDGAWTWALQGATPFEPHRRGLSIAYDLGLTSLLTNSGAAAAMAETAPMPYSGWTDITDALPIDGGIVFAEWITP